jgi:hypothetical protein
MKKLILATVLYLLQFITVFGQTEDKLATLNGDFEKGTLEGWRFVEVGTSAPKSTAVISTDAYSGSYAAKITWAANPAIQDLVFDLTPNVTPGKQYTYKAFAKSLSGVFILRIHCTFYNISNTVIGDHNDMTWKLTNLYTEHTYILPPVPIGTTHVTIGFRAFNSNGSRWPATDISSLIDEVSLSTETAKLNPKVMTTIIASEDVPIASLNVTEAPYNAKSDGSTDATTAFQLALDDAAKAGGAVVFAPAGNYRFNGNLTIPESVVLRGEWESPVKNASVQGTILMPYFGKGNEAASPFISLPRGSGICNLSVWYPEQSANSVSAYPWTIACNPDDASAGDNTSVVNVTLVNSYNGIKIGPVWNELHYLRNVYGTILKQGIWLSQTTDIGRIENVHFEPKYWANSGIANAPTETTILSSMKNLNSTGIIMGRSDWEYIHDVSLVGFQIGIQIIKYSDYGPNGVINALRIEKSNIGIDLVDVNPIGWAVTNSTIKVEGENAACIRVGDVYNSVVQFNTCTFGGDPKIAVRFSEKAIGRLSFQNCTFENWGQNADAPAIECVKGSVSLIGNTFKLDKLHLRLGKNVTNAHILDNSFPLTLKMDNQSSGEVLVSQEPLNTAKLSIPAHPYAPDPKPAKSNLYNVKDYGAVSNGVADNTSAFQTALNLAGQNGGGTVYIPAGTYKINSHLLVPTGVELRGIWDVPHHTISKGSVLFAYEGKYNETGTPFISLQSGAGARGFTVWYPEQSESSFDAYPWTIQTLGENCWIKDVTLSNSYQGADLASYPSAGHVVSYLAGAPLKTGISVSKSIGDGWIENVMFNPHFWERSTGYPQLSTPNINTIITQHQSQLDAFVFGSATREHVLGTFVFAANRGFYLAPDAGKSNIDVFLHGTDAGSHGVYIENNSGSKVNFVNTQLTITGDTPDGIITTAPAFGGNVSFFNSLSWGNPGPTSNFKGAGSVLLQQFHTFNGTFGLENGNSRLENISISSSPDQQYNIGAGISKVKLFGSYSANGMLKNTFYGSKSALEVDYYYNQGIKWSKLVTGWEITDKKNTWNNTLFGYKNYSITDQNAYHCEPKTLNNSHGGSEVLSVAAGGIDNEKVLYKVFDSKIFVYYDYTISYWINPQNEAGRGGYFDILFTDGTRLSQLSALAEDGLPLNASRGVIDQWTKVSCPVGRYAQGKTVQTILVGSGSLVDNSYKFLADDFSINGTVSELNAVTVNNYGLHLKNIRNPFSDSTTISYQLSNDGFMDLAIYDTKGRKLETLVESKYQRQGDYQVNWTPKTLPTGIYFCQIFFINHEGFTQKINQKLMYFKK